MRVKFYLKYYIKIIKIVYLKYNKSKSIVTTKFIKYENSYLKFFLVYDHETMRILSLLWPAHKIVLRSVQKFLQLACETQFLKCYLFRYGDFSFLSLKKKKIMKIYFWFLTRISRGRPDFFLIKNTYQRNLVFCQPIFYL